MLKAILISASAFTLAPENASDRYLDCLTLIEQDLSLGRTAAQQWTLEGGGANAQHCLALADLAAGFHRLGAVRLEEIAARKDAGDDLVRARLLAQAAEAWLRDRQDERADAALREAFTLAPGAGELHLTAAKLHANGGRWQETIAAVDAAEQSGIITVDALVQRGRAHMALGAYEKAAEDVVAALKVDFKNIDALTLRGEIQQRGVDIGVSFRRTEPSNP